jgi:hypothetical protein
MVSQGVFVGLPVDGDKDGIQIDEVCSEYILIIVSRTRAYNFGDHDAGFLLSDYP